MLVQDLEKKLANNEDIIVLDVREREEVEAAGDMIAGAQNVPMGKVFVEAANGKLPKDKKIIAVCKSGVRCEIVARELKERGFDVDYLVGGMDEWKKHH